MKTETLVQKYQMYIEGSFVDATSGEWMTSENPYTGDTWAQVARGGAEDADLAVRAAHKAFTSGPWSQLTASQRGLLMHKVGDLLVRDARKLAEAEVRDSGRLIADMLPQVSYLSQAFYYYGGLADKIQGAVIPPDRKGFFNFTRREPVGVVAALTPWNSPLLVSCMMIAPALAAGCTVVMKPSEFSSVSTLEFVELFAEAGFPAGVVNVVTGLGTEVGAQLVTHPLVEVIAFTGSDATGGHINKEAAGNFKRVMLELGGKSPNIVFEDADLDAAVNGAAAGIFGATGQSCIAGSRLLVQESIHDAFVDKLLALARTARMGDPMDPATQLGPLSTRPQYDKVLRYIDIAKKEGATLMLGGAAATRPECANGWFIEPTIFAGVTNRMRIAQEEVFGPVLSVIKFKDEADALAIANDVASAWPRVSGRATSGGRCEWQKASGHLGRQLLGQHLPPGQLPLAIRRLQGFGRRPRERHRRVNEYLQVKSVWINTGAPIANPFASR